MKRKFIINGICKDTTIEETPRNGDLVVRGRKTYKVTEVVYFPEVREVHIVLNL